MCRAKALVEPIVVQRGSLGDSPETVSVSISIVCTDRGRASTVAWSDEFAFKIVNGFNQSAHVCYHGGGRVFVCHEISHETAIVVNVVYVRSSEFGSPVIDGVGSGIVSEGTIRFALINQSDGSIVIKVGTDTIGDTIELVSLVGTVASVTLSHGSKDLDVGKGKVGVAALAILNGCISSRSISSFSKHVSNGSNRVSFVTIQDHGREQDFAISGALEDRFGHGIPFKTRVLTDRSALCVEGTQEELKPTDKHASRYKSLH